MDHLVCFWPGTLALAIRENVLPADPFLGYAQRVMNTCLKMHIPPHTIAPEITSLDKNNSLSIESQDAHNLLRPETLESLYLLWLYTEDDYYCEWSWNIFSRLEKASRVTDGYSAIKDITRHSLEYINTMPSYFLAETLKYAWLCSEKKIIENTIFNTEGHFIPKVSGKRMTDIDN